MQKLKEICERPRSQKLKNSKCISAGNIKCDDLCHLLQMLKNFNYRKRLQGYSLSKFSLLISHSATLWGICYTEKLETFKDLWVWGPGKF